MSDNNKVVEDKKEIKPTAEDFAKAYEKLCKDTGFQVVSSIAWRFSQETGDFRTVVQQSVGQLPKVI